MDHQASATVPPGSISKKHTRNRGRAKKDKDPYASAYGVIPFKMFRGRPWTPAQDLGEATVGDHVLLFRTVRSVRLLSNTRALVVLLHNSSTVRCMVTAGSHEGTVTTRMVRFAVTLPQETPIDTEGVVSLPENGKPPLIATTQQVEIQVRTLHSVAIGRAANTFSQARGECDGARDWTSI
ncbi:hypothetical protein BS78_05G006100 [Paspalum vaginatum]|nr:hypothetical protein BS78_05G006100 [Paspalum vaginatum]